MSHKNRKQKSILLLIICFFWVGYVTLSLSQAYLSAQEIVLEGESEKMEKLDFVFSTSITDLIRDNTEALEEKLKKAHELRLVHFYILQNADDVVFFKHNSGKSDALNHNYQNFDTFIDDGALTFKTIKVFEYRLTAGIYRGGPKAVLEAMWSFKNQFLFDIFLITGMLGFLSWLLLKDILSLSKILSGKDRQLDGIKSVSKEGAVLLHATKTLDRENHHLTEKNSVLSAALTPAIVAEIQSGQEVPYSFESTLARVDLNGYTQMFLKYNDGSITELLNKYFIQAREIIERYDGLIYQYVGDEIVFHFKGEREQSVRKALSCIRGLFEVAEQIEESLVSENDQCFKLKASLVFDHLRFCQLDTGYSLSGVAMIESNRLLSHIDDKSQNHLAFFDKEYEHLKDLCLISKKREAHLKGFSEASTISIVNQFTSVTHLKFNRNWDDCVYFKTNRDIEFFLKWMTEALTAEDEILFSNLFNHLKQIKVFNPSQRILDEFDKLLQAASHASAQKFGEDKYLSSVISLSLALIPSSMARPSFINTLEKSLKHRDNRVQANAIIVLGEWCQDLEFLESYIRSENNRVSADALYVTGKRELSMDLYRRLRDYAHSENPLFRASALWVVRQLLVHYKSIDPVYFATNPLINKLRELELDRKFKKAA